MTTAMRSSFGTWTSRPSRRARWAHGVLGCVVCGLLCLSLPTLARAQAPAAASAASAPSEEDRTEEAKGLFLAGRASFDAGRYADALDYFRRSYAISQRPELLYNIGIAQDRQRDDEHALQSYEAYLAALPNAPNRAEVEKRAAAIREALQARKEQGEDQSAATVPTPEQTAQAAQPAKPQPSAADDTQPAPAESKSVFKKWWFWTAVGVVVVGVTAGAVIAGGGGDDKTQAPLQPRSGVVVTTLEVAR